MARALSNANLIAALSDGIALLTNRRGYSAAAAMGRGSRGRTVEEKIMKGKEGGSVDSSSSSSWVPDPVTGYYRPANGGAEVDPAELRKMLLSRKY